MKRKISQYNCNNDFVRTFASVDEIVKEYPCMKKRKILNACDKPNRMVYNYFWDYFVPF